MSSLDELTAAGAMGLLAASLPKGVSACEYQLAFDADTSMPVLRVAMILESAVWDTDAVQACESATTAAWEILAPFGYIPDVICRTLTEHEKARGDERWERSGNC